MNTLPRAGLRAARFAVGREKESSAVFAAKPWAAIALLTLLLTLPNVARGDITTGLVDWWKFNETSGNIAYDSVGSNNVNLSGFSGDAFTGENPRMVGPRDGNQAWIVLNNESEKGVGFYYDHGANTIQDPNPPPLGVWTNYAATIDLVADTAAIYRNGVEVASGTFSDNVPQLTWAMGHNQDPNNPADFFTGQLDDVRIYDRVLTQSDVVQLVPEPSGAALASCAAISLLGVALRRRSSGRWRSA
jgi:hypothetical protein